MPVDAVVVEDLAKRIGEVSAVDGVSFQIGSGELFGLLGPNGEGKTTTINLLTGLARLDRSRMHIGGVDCTDRPKAAQHLLGAVPDGITCDSAERSTGCARGRATHGPTNSSLSSV